MLSIVKPTLKKKEEKRRDKNEKSSIKPNLKPRELLEKISYILPLAQS